MYGSDFEDHLDEVNYLLEDHSIGMEYCLVEEHIHGVDEYFVKGDESY